VSGPRGQRKPREEQKPIICPYCSGFAVLYQTSDHRYRTDYGPIWDCPKCNAWVGCRKGSFKPSGRLADAELRKAKVAAHAALDPLWKSKVEQTGMKPQEARGKAYEWLAKKLGIPAEEAQIGMFDLATCRRVIEICEPYRKKTQGGDR
jgi:hypothetical protein